MEANLIGGSMTRWSETHLLQRKGHRSNLNSSLSVPEQLLVPEWGAMTQLPLPQMPRNARKAPVKWKLKQKVFSFK